MTDNVVRFEKRKRQQLAGCKDLTKEVEFELCLGN